MKSAAFSCAFGQKLTAGAALLSMMFSLAVPPSLAAQTDPNSLSTTSPIKHVIVIIGENRSFDHVYATYKPKNGEKFSISFLKALSKRMATAAPTTHSRRSSAQWIRTANLR